MRLSSRKEALAQILKLIAEQDGAFKKAIFEDLRKNPLEFELSELAMAKNDCVEAMENLDEWAAPVAPTVSLVNKMDGCLIVPQPLGGAARARVVVCRARFNVTVSPWHGQSMLM